MFSVLYLVGKTLVRQKGSFTLPACSLGSNLIFLHDSLSNTKFIQDFGALVSVFPHLSSKPSSISVFSISVELSTADALSVLCAGTREIPVCFGSGGFSWYFQLDPITVPILGADFLWHQHLLVDVASLKVLDSSSLSAVGGVFTSSPESSEILHASLPATPSSICDLLAEFPDVLSSDGFTAAPPKQGIRHHLQTQPGPPVLGKSMGLDPEKLEIICRFYFLFGWFLGFFPNWTSRKDTTRFLCLPLTSRRMPSSLPLVCLSSSGFPLAWEMQVKCSRE